MELVGSSSIQFSATQNTAIKIKWGSPTTNSNVGVLVTMF
jgi:hypothetical protein